jgi:hypothetical protein
VRIFIYMKNTIVTTFSALRDVEQMIEITSSMQNITETRNLIRERNRLKEELSNLIIQEKLGRLY